jgi:diguanylate cyclase (GGDEF)-like protein/PAS domain S-box-containing protein
MSFFEEAAVCRNILESLPTGLCVVDIQKKIIFWSVGAERITGHLRHEVVGRCLNAEPLLHCDHPGCEFCSEECPLDRAIKTSQPTDATGFLHHKAGHEVPVRLRSVPLHNEHGSIIGAVETFEDLEQLTADDEKYGARLSGCVDEVTGVATRAMTQSHLRETLANFGDAHVPFGILCVQIEGLEGFRASFGSEAASSLLRVTARTLESALWRTDFVGRWADDQFLVILNGCRDTALHSVRQRIRRMLASDAIDWWGERRTLPVSIGQATVRADDTIESMLDHAFKSLDAASTWRAHSAAAGTYPSSGSQ